MFINDAQIRDIAMGVAAAHTARARHVHLGGAG